MNLGQQTNSRLDIKQVLRDSFEVGGGVFETKQYGLFKFIDGNREIKNKHVNELMSSIAKRNLLRDNPIFVTEKMEVIDGQHRLAAAEKLDIPIPYKVIPDFMLDDIQILNANNRSWDLNDYLNWYVIRGVRDYSELKDFIQSYELSVSIGVIIMSGFTLRNEYLKVFKAGGFRIANKERAEEFANNAYDLQPFAEFPVIQSRDMLRALNIFYQKHDHKKLMDKLQKNKPTIQRSAMAGGYVEQLERIYNS